MLNVKAVSSSMAVWSGITFVVCILYGLFVPGSLSVHQGLGQVLPGFRWLTFGGFLIGLGWTIVYGVYAGWLFAAIYNRLSKRWAAAG
jgi:hypothetical protein